MTAYYNEIEPYAAEWLRNLIAAGLIADGEVDERSILDVTPADIAGFTQCHFFAGIGGWPLALRIAGWPDDRPVWTGSCPCQPFSAAGKRGGFDDERHLWPAWHWLIEQCGPEIVFGEQVASKDGLGWLDLVQADLEGLGYAFGSSDLCAAGVGAPHIRQRLWFVAHADREIESGGRIFGPGEGDGAGVGTARERSAGLRPDGRTADADDAGPQGRVERGNGAGQRASRPSGVAGRMADADGRNAGAEGLQRGGQYGQQPQDGGAGALADASVARHDEARQHERGSSQLPARSAEHGGVGGSAGPTNGFWRDADWLLCRDEKWRPVEPGTFPLAHGIPNRVGRLRAYGNAIVPQVAAEFIRSYAQSVEGRETRNTTTHGKETRNAL